MKVSLPYHNSIVLFFVSDKSKPNIVMGQGVFSCVKKSKPGTHRVIQGLAGIPLLFFLIGDGRDCPNSHVKAYASAHLNDEDSVIKHSTGS